MKRKAFTLIELMVVVVIIGLLISILLPSLAQAREAARRAKCLANLRGFGNTLKIYSSRNNDQYPMVGQGKKIDGTNMSVANGVDTMASMWLLVTSKMSSPEAFICPSDTPGGVAFNDKVDQAKPFPKIDSNGLMDDTGKSRCWSYAYQIPNGDKGNPAKDNVNSTKFAIMADRAPFYEDLKLLGAEDTLAKAKTFLAGLPDDAGNKKEHYNSPNHGGDGQNILFQDGHADWKAHPWCGIRDDNIYTWATDTTVVGRMKGEKKGSASAVTDLPYDDDDSVLVNILEGVPCVNPSK